MTITERRRQLAKALDVVPDYVRALAKRGMPLDLEGAIEWRKQHVPLGRKPRPEPFTRT